MTAEQLARLTLEVWRPSGDRTTERRDALLHAYAETYYGPSAQWGEDVRSLVDCARLITRQCTRIDELVYA